MVKVLASGHEIDAVIVHGPVPVIESSEADVQVPTDTLV